MKFIDTHSHIYAEQFNTDSTEMLQNAVDARVEQVIMPAIDASTHEVMLALERENPKRWISMMGLHPCSVNEHFEKELLVVEKYLATQKFIGIGEIGLDFHWDITYTKEQYIAFERQIEWAIDLKLPIAIHSRKSNDECIAVVKKYQKGNLSGVFHCYSGTENQAKRIVDLGFYMGIGGVLTFKNAGLKEVIKTIPIEHLLLETDAPYLAPVPYRGKRNEPKYIPLIAQEMADLLETDTAVIAAKTTENALRLFKELPVL